MASLVPFGSLSEGIRVESAAAAGQAQSEGGGATARVSPAHVDRQRLLPVARAAGDPRGREFTVGGGRGPGEATGRDHRRAGGPAALPDARRQPGRAVRPGRARARTASRRSARGVGCGARCARRSVRTRAVASPVRAVLGETARVDALPRAPGAGRACRGGDARHDQAGGRRARSAVAGAVGQDAPVVHAGQRVPVALPLGRDASSPAFGLAALVLALVGIYGVNAYMVLRRTREIGIRMALGAAPHDVVRLIVRDTGLVTAAGVVVGTRWRWPSAACSGRCCTR